MNTKISVCGIGPGSEDLMTAEVRIIIGEADMVLTSLKDNGALEALNGDLRQVTVPEMLSLIEKVIADDRGVKLAVAASGDTGFHSVATTIVNKFPGVDIDIYPGIGTISYFMARIGKNYQDLKALSFHGIPGTVIPFAAYNKKVFCLTDNKVTPKVIAEELTEAGMGDRLQMYVGENLSSPTEHITCGTPKELAEREYSKLSVVYLENPDVTDRFRTLRDDDFIRGGVPMTKEEVRTLVISKLDIHPDDTVYDVGAGTGSVTVGMAYRACEGTIYAVEKDPEGVELINRNREALGAWNIKVLQGTAPEALEELPAPDKVFIGGSKGNLKEIVSLCLEKNPEAVIVITTVTLDTMAEAMELTKEQGMQSDTVCINVSRAKRMGSYDLMKAENPVYIITLTKEQDEETQC
ncbi:MAG: precorrin-6y C5,15-methyltransferase (decarboxylating) subunit CbiE [Firmicutes bacterium]|nr:precorrin-6y C5,15-methyltransferase (decarboxylating) subunit CbiE [Bacillota bacterium]